MTPEVTKGIGRLKFDLVEQHIPDDCWSFIPFDLKKKIIIKKKDVDNSIVVCSCKKKKKNIYALIMYVNEVSPVAVW